MPSDLFLIILQRTLFSGPLWRVRAPAQQLQMRHKVSSVDKRLCVGGAAWPLPTPNCGPCRLCQGPLP